MNLKRSILLDEKVRLAGSRPLCPLGMVLCSVRLRGGTFARLLLLLSACVHLASAGAGVAYVPRTAVRAPPLGGSDPRGAARAAAPPPPLGASARGQNTTRGSPGCVSASGALLNCSHSSSQNLGFLLGAVLCFILLLASGVSVGFLFTGRRRHAAAAAAAAAAAEAPKAPAVKLEGPYPGVRITLPGEVGATHLAWPEALDAEASRKCAGRSPDSTVHSASSYMDLVSTSSWRLREGGGAAADVAIDIPDDAAAAAGTTTEHGGSVRRGAAMVRTGSCSRVQEESAGTGAGDGGVPVVHRTSSAPDLSNGVNGTATWAVP